MALTLAELRAVERDKPGRAGRAGSAHATAAALARATGTSLGEARRAIVAGQALADQPEVAGAARSGQLEPPAPRTWSSAKQLRRPATNPGLSRS